MNQPVAVPRGGAGGEHGTVPDRSHTAVFVEAETGSRVAAAPQQHPTLLTQLSASSIAALAVKTGTRNLDRLTYPPVYGVDQALESLLDGNRTGRLSVTR